MYKKLLIAGLTMLCCTQTTNAQSELDKYIGGNNTFNVIGDISDGVINPQDLDFVPGVNQWWILNYGVQEGGMTIFYDAGGSNEHSEYRRDSHAAHFMIRPSAMAFGNNSNFATTQEIQSTNGGSSTFMGPTLWNGDTSVYGRLEQNVWGDGKLQGSHIDMLHQSPYSMGIAHDQENAYWVFDGYNGNICHYDFKEPHIVGGHDHSDGEILRYSDVTVKREPGVPSHIAYDKANKWLYIVDGGNKRIIRMKTDNATDAGALSVPPSGNEPLARYRNMTGATVEVLVSSGLDKPCGIDYKDGRIVVSDNATGDIIIYDVTQNPTKELGRIKTEAGVMGVRIGWDNRIWFVNKNKKTFERIDNSAISTSVATTPSDDILKVYPNPAKNVVFVELAQTTNNVSSTVKLYDITGKNINQVTTTGKRIEVNTTGIPTGIYTLEITAGEKTYFKKLAIE